MGLQTRSSSWPAVDCSSQNHLTWRTLSVTPAFPNGDPLPVSTVMISSMTGEDKTEAKPKN